MENLLSHIKLQVDECIYIKDPVSSDLGKKIISGSINLIEELGYEQFTFRKLADLISSTEASIYRYFESKHKLLVYLTSWYWHWLEYRVVFAISNIPNPKTRLQNCINLITATSQLDNNFDYVNEVKLNRIVISESSKAYLTKEVTSENEAGAFKGYKRLVERISNIILEVNPKYKYPHMLVSTVIEGAHFQRYFAAHLPKLTDVIKGEDAITSFYLDMVNKSIEINS